MTGARVGVIGACNVDLIAYVPRLPKEGETLHGFSFEQGFGGKGANQAVQAALLGSSVVFISKVGDDSYGNQFREKLRSYDIDDQFVFTEASLSTGIAPIAVDQAGNNSIIIIPGANNTLTEDELQRASESISQCKVFIAQLELPLEINMKSLKLAKSLGVLTILNTAPAPSEPLPSEIYEFVDIICANQVEIQMLSGIQVSSTADAEEASRKLIQMGAQGVLVTLGSDGCMFVSKDQSKPICIPGEKVDQVVDTSGAGDSFLGAFIHFLALEKSIEHTMKAANYVAAQSVKKKGTQSSYSSKTSLPEWLFE